LDEASINELRRLKSAGINSIFLVIDSCITKNERATTLKASLFANNLF
jgi:hypothetical protein